MIASKLAAKLNEQIGHEFDAHQQYVAIATHFEAYTMPRMASLFYDQAVEERGHAMMLVKYLVDREETVKIPALDAPKWKWKNVVEPVKAALDQEKQVAEQFNELSSIARKENDYTTEQFLQWFLKEQVEEIAKMGDLLAVVTRSAENVERIEDWVSREETGDVDDPTAPAQAGS